MTYNACSGCSWEALVVPALHRGNGPKHACRLAAPVEAVVVEGDQPPGVEAPPRHEVLVGMLLGGISKLRAHGLRGSEDDDGVRGVDMSYLDYVFEQASALRAAGPDPLRSKVDDLEDQLEHARGVIDELLAANAAQQVALEAARAERDAERATLARVRRLPDGWEARAAVAKYAMIGSTLEDAAADLRAALAPPEGT